jgi:hypothetical protein
MLMSIVVAGYAGNLNATGKFCTEKHCLQDGCCLFCLICLANLLCNVHSKTQIGSEVYDQCLHASSLLYEWGTSFVLRVESPKQMKYVISSAIALSTAFLMLFMQQAPITYYLYTLV